MEVEVGGGAEDTGGTLTDACVKEFGPAGSVGTEDGGKEEGGGSDDAEWRDGETEEEGGGGGR